MVKTMIGSPKVVLPKLDHRIPETYHFNGRVNQHSKLSISKVIEDSVSQSDWKHLLEGPFGPILKMCNKISFSSRLVHFMLLREAKTEKKREMWFKMQNRVARFSIKEFALITGLNCGKIKEIPAETKNIVTKFFGKNISIAELESIFLMTPSDTTKKVKLAMLLILEGILLGADKKKKVRSLGVHMMQDLDMFNSFPWGRIVYEETIDALHRGIPYGGSKETPKADNYGYNLYGFPWAFQVWIYEAMPEMGNAYASIVPNMENAIPRCLRWSSSKTPDYVDVVESFSGWNGSFIQVNPKVLLFEEENELLGDDVCFDDEEKDKKVDAYVKALELGFKKRKSRRMSRIAEYTDANTIHSDIFSDRLGIIEWDIRQNKVVLECLTICVEAIMQKMEIPARRHLIMKDTVPHIQLKETHPVKTQQQEEKRILPDRKRRKRWDASSQFVNPILKKHNEDSHPNLKLKPEEEKRMLPDRRSGKRRDASSQFLNPIIKKHEVGKTFNKPLVHKTDRHIWWEEDKKALIEWLEDESAAPIKSSTGRELNTDFFKRMAQEEHWLRGEDLEEALSLMRKRVQDFPERYRKVVILDAWWSCHMKTEWDSWITQKQRPDFPFRTFLNDYIIGKVPDPYPKPWVEADTILCSFNIREVHWVALQIDLPSWTINVFDSDITLYKDDDIFEELRPVSGMLPKLLSSAISAKYADKADEQFACHRVTGLPRNVRSGDCGAYTIKYIDSLSSGMKELSFINDNYVTAYRDKIASDIFNRRWI